jgi:hypothetical protein
MIVFVLLGLILIAPVGVVYGQALTPTPKTQRQLNLGQTHTLNKLNLENSQSTQCLDFNQDKICEYYDQAEEETENCGGEPCTPTEKEDSWLEDDAEYGDQRKCVVKTTTGLWMNRYPVNRKI